MPRKARCAILMARCCWQGSGAAAPRALVATHRPPRPSELDRQHGTAAGGLAGKDALWQVLLPDAPSLNEPPEVALLDLQRCRRAGRAERVAESDRAASACLSTGEAGPKARRQEGRRQAGGGAGSSHACALLPACLPPPLLHPRPASGPRAHLVDERLHLRLLHQRDGAAAPAGAGEARANGARRLVDLRRRRAGGGGKGRQGGRGRARGAACGGGAAGWALARPPSSLTPVPTSPSRRGGGPRQARLGTGSRHSASSVSEGAPSCCTEKDPQTRSYGKGKHPTCTSASSSTLLHSYRSLQSGQG